MKVNFNIQKIAKNNPSSKPKKSIIKYKKAINKINFNHLKVSRNQNNSSNRLSIAQNSNSLPTKEKIIKNIDPNALVFDSPYIQSKQKDFNGLCNDLKTLEIQKRNAYGGNNMDFDIYIEEEFDFSNMQNNLKLNHQNIDYNNIAEILKIVDKVKIPPEKRSMNDLLEIVKYLTTTKLGKSFKEGFDQKEIFEKLITFCGVEMKYKFFKKGETVFKIGELPDFFYIILWGKVDILKPLPQNKSLTGFQYFCYLMNLKKSNDEHLFNLCIQANKINYRIDFEDAKDLHYIYIYIIIEQINRHKRVLFGEELKLVNMSYKDFELDPEKINDTKYISENIKHIKIFLPDISTSIISKYLFIIENSTSKDVTIYNYSPFLSLETKSHFGDSAMDSNTTRNATIAASEDTHTAYISCASYFNNVVVEKAALIEKKVQFLNSNFIFRKIGQKKFEKKYFGLFICNNYKKGDIIYSEGDLPLNVYFIEQGDVELYSSKNIYELQNVIEYLEEKRLKFMKRKDEELSEEKDYMLTYGKINFDEHDLRKDIIKKNKNKIFLLKENEDLGILSFYFGYPYFTTSIVSSVTARIYQIDNKYLSEMILKERICYNDLINRVEHKLSLFHQRFFNINNTKLLLADHQKSLDSRGERNNIPILNSSNNNINNKNININNSLENLSYNQKNNFNKTIMKINYGKLKQIFNKMQKSNIHLNTKYKNFSQYKTKSRINNYLQKTNFPLISLHKTLKPSDNISTDKTYSIKLKTLEINNDEINSSSKGTKNKNKNDLIKKNNIFKNITVNRVISMEKNKNRFNLSNYIFKNKSCIFLEEKKYCIDPVLKESYENYEKMKKNKFKRIQMKNLEKLESEEEQKMKTQSLINKNISYNKNTLKKQLNDIKPYYNNINNSLSCKPKSLSTNNMIFGNDYRDEEVEKDDNGRPIKKEKGLNCGKNDALTKKMHRTKINHPYFSPLVLKKKQQYEIFKGEKIVKEKTQIKKIRKSFNEKRQFNKLGYFFKFINKFNKNYPYKN